MLTKNQFKIMEVFVSNITTVFSIREIARILNMNNSLAHRSIKPLIEKNILNKNDKGFLHLNYKENHEIISFVEYIRRNIFLEKNKTINLLKKDIVKNLPYEYFVFLIFGSTVTNSKPRDLDLLLIIEKTNEIEQAEKYLYNIIQNYNLNSEILVVSFESVFEMLKSRDDKNVMNEVLNKHIILYGAELFYKLINKGRK